MGTMYAAGFAQMAEEGTISREVALSAHLAGNFFPPLPQYVKDSTVAAFKEHWAGEIEDDELRERCYLKSLDGLYRYHGCFMNQEEEL